MTRLVSITFVVVFFIIAFTVPGRAEMVTPFSYDFSYDGQDALVYRMVNTFFGLTGQNALTGNEQLYETYGMENPGAIMANQAKIFTLTSTASEPSGFTIFGDSTANILYNSNVFPATNNITQFYNSTAIFNDDDYTGALNFSISNSNGTFYSDAETYTNVNALGGMNADEADVHHFIYFDVTELMQEYLNLGFEYTTAYLVGFEDRAYYSSGGKSGAWDGDYNDGLFIVFNNEPLNVTPEPASFVVFGIGLAGLGLMRRVRKNSRNCHFFSRSFR